jgi:hypothetical protein
MLTTELFYRVLIPHLIVHFPLLQCFLVPVDIPAFGGHDGKVLLLSLGTA